MYGVVHVCESPRLEDTQKVKLDSGVFNKCDDNQVLSEHPILFKGEGSLQV